MAKNILYKVLKKEQQKEYKIEKFDINKFSEFSSEYFRNHPGLKANKNRINKSMPTDKLEEKKSEIIIDESVVEEKKNEGYKTGYEDGFKKGYDDGLKKGEEEVNEKIETIKSEYIKTFKKIENLRENIYKDAENEMVSIVKEAIKKVISSNINNSEEFILNVLKDTIKDNIESKNISIRVSPEDYEFLENSKEQLGKLFTGKEFKLIKDNSITRGGCIIETDFGEIDSTVETKLEEVLKVLEDKND